jgi:nickel superoxide dismutase
MNRSLIPALLLAGLAAALAPTLALAHCQVPCGIYEDEMRFGMIEEDLQTIEKAMAQITELGSAQGDRNYNQIVRWVTTKEEHARKIQDIVNAYFLTQRIKPVEPGTAGFDDYQKSLTHCHHLLVQAMKCKQTTDAANVAAARTALAAYHELYFKDKEHDHK